MELTTLRVAAALEAAGIANVPLKGPLLARSLHGDPGMRLLARHRRAGARARTSSARPPRSSRSGGAPRTAPASRCSTSTLTHDARLPEVELHWRVHWYETEFARARAGAGAARTRRRAAPAASWTSSPR